MQGDRMRQVNELIHHAVSEIISRRIELPPESFVTITEVDTSRDLKHADVYLMVIPDGRRVSTMKYIQSHSGLIQRELGKTVQIKFTPKLRFRFDERRIKAQQVYDVLDAESDHEASDE